MTAVQTSPSLARTAAKGTGGFEASPRTGLHDEPTTDRALHLAGGGERKNVTVLFADIADSTALIDNLDPEAAAGRLQPLLDAMREAVHRYAGTVNKIQGDGIMALFGAPIALEDHAGMGCYAALAMQAAAFDIDNIGPKLRIGLHSGEVLVRSIGNDLSIDYDAIGPTVHLAGRMEQMASPGSIYLTEQTYRLASGMIRVEALGLTEIKGLRDPLPIYQLKGDRGARTRWAVRASRGLSPLIGRERDMDFLTRAMSKAEAGRGQVVAVSGPAGIGKSRLLHEFNRKKPLQRDWQIMEMGAVPYGETITYLPISNFLRTWLSVTANDGQDDIRRKLKARIGRLAAELSEVLPALESLLDLPVQDEAWQQLDPPQRRQRIMDAIKLLILAGADRKPMLLVFEDLHWMDSETLAELDNLLDAIAGARVLLIVTYRPGFEHGWLAKSYYVAVHMEPLDSDAVDQLLHHLIGADSSNAPLKQLMASLSQGTPLFLEELVRVLVEDGALVGGPGSYVLTRAVADIKVPESVQTILAARIDNLAAEQKDLLQIASVIGKTFSLTLLQDVADMPKEELLVRLSRLQSAEFVYATRLFPDAEYTFKHVLTQDVAYNGALQERRRNLHRRVLLAIEARYHNRLDEFVESQAYHAARAEEWEKAVGFLERAGNKAIERSAYPEAITHFEAAVTALGYLPADVETIRRTIGLRLSLRAAFGPMGELDRMYEHLRQAEEEAQSIDDRNLLAAVNISKTFVFTLNGDLDDAIAAGEAALAIASDLADPDLVTSASVFLGQAQQFRGDFTRALETLVPVQDHLKGEARYSRLGTTSTTSVLALYILAFVRASVGDFAGALEAGQEAVKIAEVVDRPYDHSLALGAVGTAHLWHGDLDTAIIAFEQGIEVCKSGDIRSMYPWLSAQAGCAYAFKRNGAQAAELLETARSHSEGMSLVYYHAWAIAFSGTAALQVGEHEDARRYLEQALRLSEQHGYQAVKAWSLRHLGAGNLRNGDDLATREEYLLQAKTLADAAGMRPELAHSHRMLAALYHDAGRHEAAQAERERADRLYDALGMTYWTTGPRSDLIGAP